MMPVESHLCLYMKKINIKTNQGKVHDWFLNKLINFVLWIRRVDNKEDAIKITHNVIRFWTFYE